jgi:iron complex outermembrane recepter protein
MKAAASLVRASLFVVPYLLAAPAFAQSASVEEVVVTAQKRSERLQNVPISINALTDDAIRKSNITSLDSVQRYAPGLTMSTVGSGFVSYTYLRGAGTNQIDAGSDPSVAFFIDEVYIAGTPGLQFDLFDAERIEVLKGPQGTLFGRNAAAGAISITTKKPMPTFGAELYGEVGDYDAFTMRGNVTGPLTKDGSLLGRVSIGYRRRGAFTENLAGGSDPGDIDSIGGRAQLEYVFNDGSFLVTAEHIRARNGMTNQFLASATKTGLVAASVVPTLPAGEDFYKHFYNVVGFENQDLSAVTGRLELGTRLGRLTSITAYRDNEFDRVQDQDGTIAASYKLSTASRDKSFSQEVRLADDPGRLHWVAGLYFFRGSTVRSDQIDAGPSFPTVVAQNRTAIDSGRITTDSYAAFAQATYDLTERLGLTLGGRYTIDRKHDERSVQGLLAPIFFVNPHARWSSFDPAATISYKINPSLMTYLSYRQGYKSGGFQTLLPSTAAIAATPFEPEKVRSYEAGVKSEWFDRKLQVNVALFRADISNQQILRIGAVAVQTIDNAGATRTDGADVSIAVVPVAGLRFDANMTFQRARFRTYQNGALSYAGNHQLRSPDFMGSYGAEYGMNVANGTLTLRGEYTYRSTEYYDAANTVGTGLYQPGYGLVNARLSWMPASGAWEVAAFAKNLGDEKYLRNIAVSGTTGLAVPGDPLTFGVSFRATFN